MLYSTIAYKDGQIARDGGYSIDSNPYNTREFDKYHSWNLGWNGFPPDNYQMMALETWHNKDVPMGEQANHAMLQLAAECFEVMKLWAYKPISRDEVLNELGDLWYYVRIVAFLYDITVSELSQVSTHEKNINPILQLAGKCGDVVKLWAKHLYKPGHDIDRDKVLEPLGKLYHFMRVIALENNITIDELTRFNYEKLKGGYGWNGSDEKIKSRMDGAK